MCRNLAQSHLVPLSGDAYDDLSLDAPVFSSQSLQLLAKRQRRFITSNRGVMAAVVRGAAVAVQEV